MCWNHKTRSFCHNTGSFTAAARATGGECSSEMFEEDTRYTASTCVLIPTLLENVFVSQKHLKIPSELNYEVKCEK